jgi:Protein of unknown function (DUF3128)
MSSNDVVDCNAFIFEWSKCLTGKYQRDQMYRLGKFDDCGNQWQDVRTSFYIKLFVSNDDDAKKLLQNTYYYKSTTISPTIGVIWEAKEKPGWH